MNPTLDIFIEVYQAYPAQIFGKTEVELTNSIILPPSALEKLAGLNKGFGKESSPVLFRILNIELNLYTHCGVAEFTADEGTCLLPTNMFNRLCLNEGMMVNLRNINLTKGKLIKIQPHLTDFIKNPNPRAILENNLRNFFCLTKGDTITVQFNKKFYDIDIVECKPKDAISLTNVDIEVDFEKPKDYVEEVEVPVSTNFTRSTSGVVMGEEKVTKALSEDEIKQKIQDDKFKGNCVRIDGKKITETQLKNFEKDKLEKEAEETYDPRKNRLVNGVRNENANIFKGDGVRIAPKKK